MAKQEKKRLALNENLVHACDQMCERKSQKRTQPGRWNSPRTRSCLAAPSGSPRKRFASCGSRAPSSSTEEKDVYMSENSPLLHYDQDGRRLRVVACSSCGRIGLEIIVGLGCVG